MITQSLLVKYQSLVRSTVHQLLCTIFPQKHPHGTSNCIYKNWYITCKFLVFLQQFFTALTAHQSAALSHHLDL